MWFLKNEELAKESVAKNISMMKSDGFYWILFALAVMIATLGLVQNSPAVTIGAMLIAPLLRPISILAFSLANMHNGKIYKNLKVILISIILGILLSYSLSYLFPIKINTSEILSRTNPNILDLVIAFLSGIVAFVALIYRDWILESISGVAIATSLVPPLSVVGIELAYGEYFLAWNSFLLFFTNLITIIFTGVLIFLAIGFRPHQEEDQQKFKLHSMIILFIFSIIILPLIVSLINIKNQIMIKNIFMNELGGSENRVVVEDVNVVFKKNKYLINLDLDLDSKVNIEEIKKRIEKLKEEIQKDVVHNKKVEVNLRIFRIENLKI